MLANGYIHILSYIHIFGIVSHGSDSPQNLRVAEIYSASPGLGSHDSYESWVVYRAMAAEQGTTSLGLRAKMLHTHTHSCIRLTRLTANSPGHLRASVHV